MVCGHEHCHISGGCTGVTIRVDGVEQEDLSLKKLHGYALEEPWLWYHGGSL